MVELSFGYTKHEYKPMFKNSMNKFSNDLRKKKDPFGNSDFGTRIHLPYSCSAVGHYNTLGRL